MAVCIVLFLPSHVVAYGGHGLPPEAVLDRPNPRQPTSLRTRRGVLVPRTLPPTRAVQTRVRTHGSPDSRTSPMEEKSDAGTMSIAIERFAFSPAKATVKRGSIVTWRNMDDTLHTITGEEGRGPQSGRLQKGTTFSYVFLQEGTFPYFCTPHRFMRGIVEVVP